MDTAPFTLRNLIWSTAAVLLSLGLRAQEKQADWPLVFTAGDDQVQVFKPQPETFDGTRFTARAAVALQRPQDSSPIFGAIWGNGVLAVDRSNRMGTLTTFKVTDARFPGLSGKEENDRVKAMLSEAIPEHAAPIPIDWLVAALEVEKQSAASYDNAPPTVIYKDKPSILVFIDGDPIYKALKDKDAEGGDPVYAGTGTPLERVVNTPYLIVRPKGGANWLYGSGLWYSAKDINGPWAYEKKAPSQLEQLAQEVDTASTREKPVDGIIPEVVVTTRPAVLLDLNGAPQMQPFDNTSLMYVTNTDKDLFMDIPTQEYYFLASGRWYASKDLQHGPWRYVPSSELPADFAKVPEGSAKDGILAHVAGTNAAREAVRDASIPQTAQVARSTTVSVHYDGDPQFRRIAGTDVYSAENASTTVLRINGRYHVCDNAVWYEGDSPVGPWTVSTSVPAQVNEIPASDPDYRVRYVYIYDSTPDNVFVGYTPGYLGSYVQGGTVIYGTGYYYRPWYRSYWYPRPYTWAFNMYYNPWSGWGFGASWGYDWFYPRWNYYGYYRPYAWGWWGPYGYCPGSWNHYAYGHGYGYGHFYGHDHGNGRYYGHRGSLTASSGERAANGMRKNDLYTNHRVEGVRPSETGRNRLAAVDRTNKAPSRTETKQMRPISGDHFTDRQGNVYRAENGKTEELRNGRWVKINEESGTNDRIRNNNATEARPQTSPRTRTTEQPRRNQPATRPSPRPTQRWNAPRQESPQHIQQERTRGEQRVNDYRGWRQQRSAPTHRSPSPTRHSAPSRHSSPTRSSPTHSAPSRTAPSRSVSPGRSGGNKGVRRSR